VNAGVWPPSLQEITKFQIEYLKSLNNSDAIAMWGHDLLKNENSKVDSIKHQVFRFPLSVLDPLQLSLELIDTSIWSDKLFNLNVLVVSNLSKSIKLQYAKHEQKSIHTHNFLPKFNLFTVNPPLTQGLIFWNGRWSINLKDFNERVRYFCTRNRIDIALIAAGSYGLPIGSFLKSIGVKSIYMGGSLQLMFGIMGQRWAQSKSVSVVKNDNWLKSPIEKPPFGFRLIERKSYW
jgi:hypothetical protein